MQAYRELVTMLDEGQKVSAVRLDPKLPSRKVYLLFSRGSIIPSMSCLQYWIGNQNALDDIIPDLIGSFGLQKFLLDLLDVAFRSFHGLIWILSEHVNKQVLVNHTL